MKQWLAERPPNATTIFCNLTTKRKGKALSASTPNHTLQAAAKKAGVDCKALTYTSLRKTGPTRARTAGVDRLAVMRAGNWKSNAVDAYLVVQDAEFASITDAIVNDAESDDEIGELAVQQPATGE